MCIFHETKEVSQRLAGTWNIDIFFMRYRNLNTHFEFFLYVRTRLGDVEGAASFKDQFFGYPLDFLTGYLVTVEEEGDFVCRHLDHDFRPLLHELWHREFDDLVGGGVLVGVRVD